MSGLRRRRKYDKEFKLEAVRLVLEERPLHNPSKKFKMNLPFRRYALKIHKKCS